MFAKRLRKLRESKEMTQREVADLLGLTPKAVGFYEQGKREPTHEALLKLSEIFQVSVDYLLCKTDIKNYSDAFIKDYMENSPELLQLLKSQGYKIEEMTKEEILDLINKGAQVNEIYKKTTGN